MKKVQNKIRPLAKWVKNSAMILLVIAFATVMIWLALDKDYDKLVALAGILVAVISAPIFSVRAELEKHLFMKANDKKYEAYRILDTSLQDWLGNLYSMEIDTDTNRQAKYRIGFENGLTEFCRFYKQYSLFLSYELARKMHDICLLASHIDLPTEKMLKKDFLKTAKEIEKLHKETKDLMRQELGL